MMGRSGFTIVDLLITIGVVTVLLGIFLPAVQGIRESARSVACKNKLKQIGIAATNFESANNRLPPGSLGFQDSIVMDGGSIARWRTDPGYRFYWKRSQHTSFLVLVLAYLGKPNLYDKLPHEFLNESKPLYASYSSHPRVGWAGEFESVAELAATRIADVHCASDSSHELFDNRKILYLTSQPVFLSDENRDGIFATPAAEIGFQSYLSNYFGCGGAYAGGSVPSAELLPFEGAFTCRKGKPLSAFSDGLSNTLLVGESIGEVNEGKKLGGFAWCFGGIIRGRGWLPWGAVAHPTRKEVKLFGYAKYSHASSFGSFHPLAINTTFADGSVHAIGRGIDIRTWYAICGARDGIVADAID